MKRRILILLIITFGLCTKDLNAQATEDYAVRVSATVQEAPAKITLQWPADTNAQSYVFYKKTKDTTRWTYLSRISTGAKALNSYTDTNVISGGAYEYEIIKYANNSGNAYTGYGYIYAGIKLAATGYRGKLILMVDSTFAISLAPEIKRLQQDITGDGWNVITHYVNSTDTVPAIQQIIGEDYYADKLNVKALFLLGHVPVPYSGNFNPDGHPSHLGAWPADEYYGDLSGSYTDFVVDNDTSAYRLQNKNVPFDGKFDQSTIAGKVLLEIGRVDMHDLPSFNTSDALLLKRYLDKDHNFRVKNFTAPERAIVDDNFGAFGGEAFAASGYKAFAPMFGDANVTAGKTFPGALDSSYLCGYNCGGGWFQGASGVGATDSFVNDSVRIVFSMSFGSWFGDWDASDDFLRAPLASKGFTLTNCWSGRPHWQLHHMALGDNIGYDAMVTQNNNYFNPTYFYNIFGGCIHVALMGDPTLRLHVIAPPSGLSIQPHQPDSTMHLSWVASSDKVLGYNIYRARSAGQPFYLVNKSIITSTNYVDSFPKNGNNVYLVRAINLKVSGSGSYYNQSQGIYDSATINAAGIFSVADAPVFIHVYPNPSNGSFYVAIPSQLSGMGTYHVKDMTGKEILNGSYINISQFVIDLANYPAGVYLLSMNTEKAVAVQKLVKE